MPALNITFTEQELEQLRATAAEKKASLNAFAHDAVVHTAREQSRAAIEEALDRGYAELAKIWDEVHDEAEHRARLRRYAEEVDQFEPGA